MNEYAIRKQLDSLRKEVMELECDVARKEARDDVHYVITKLFVPVWSALAKSHTKKCTAAPCTCHMAKISKALEKFEEEFDRRFPFDSEL